MLATSRLLSISQLCIKPCTDSHISGWLTHFVLLDWNDDQCANKGFHGWWSWSPNRRSKPKKKNISQESFLLDFFFIVYQIRPARFLFLSTILIYNLILYWIGYNLIYCCEKWVDRAVEHIQLKPKCVNAQLMLLLLFALSSLLSRCRGWDERIMIHGYEWQRSSSQNKDGRSRKYLMWWRSSCDQLHMNKYTIGSNSQLSVLPVCISLVSFFVFNSVVSDIVWYDKTQKCEKKRINTTAAVPMSLFFLNILYGWIAQVQCTFLIFIVTWQCDVENTNKNKELPPTYSAAISSDDECKHNFRKKKIYMLERKKMADYLLFYRICMLKIP